jgi:hypothetical protein
MESRALGRLPAIAQRRLKLSVISVTAKAMSQQMPEPDWKVLSKLRKAPLEGYAEQTLAKVTQALGHPEGTTHKTFLKLYQLINDRNREVARLFDDFRRSTALTYLRMLRNEGLITDSEIQELSGDTREFVEHTF